MGVSAGDILRTTVNFILNDGTLQQNVYHHQRTGVAIIDDAAHVATLKQWAEDAYNELIAEVKSDVVEQLSFVDKVAWVTDAWEVVENIGTFTPTFNPSGAAEALPNQSSAYVVFKTERPKSVGRKFLMPFIETTQSGTYLGAGTVTALVAYADDVVNNITLEVLNYLVPGIPRTGADVWLPFVIAVVTNVLGSQRRRRPGVGA